MSNIIELAKGLSIKKGDDGHWLNFKSPDGKHASVCLENVSNGSIIGAALIGWAEDICKPGVKKIDMFRCIDSGIDCEFSKSPEFKVQHTRIGKLYSIGPNSNGTRDNDYCRPRMDNIHAVDGTFDKQPIPEGFIIIVYFKNNEVYQGQPHEFDWKKINRFKVIGLAKNWEL